MRPRRGADIALFHTFTPPPYGGSNQFLLALRGELTRRGYTVAANEIGRRTRACLLNAFLVDREKVRRDLVPGCRVLHRVDGPVAVYRGWDDGTDRTVSEISRELADITVFQSRYSREANAAQGYEFATAAAVIPNATDPQIFHPGERRGLQGGKVRLISVSWSDNPNKGSATYKWLEERLDWARFDWTFVGRSPVAFERIRMLPPAGSHEVAALLRQHDVFVFASRHESCSNALLEALACGLPALYVDSGGNAELVGEGGLAFGSDDELPELLEQLVQEYDERQASIRVPALDEVVDRYLHAMGLPEQPEPA